MPIKCIQKRRRSNVVEKFRKVNITVWVGLKGMLWENTLKEEWISKNDFYDNYNYYGEGWSKHWDLNFSILNVLIDKVDLN